MDTIKGIKGRKVLLTLIFRSFNFMIARLLPNKTSEAYYCDANRSDQKAKVEKNHVYIRYIIPKGTSMDYYEQTDIDLMMSHINSTAREVLNFAIPYDMASIYLGMDSMKKLNLFKIQPDDIILKPYLINNKK